VGTRWSGIARTAIHPGVITVFDGVALVIHYKTAIALAATPSCDALMIGDAGGKHAIIVD